MEVKIAASQSEYEEKLSNAEELLPEYIECVENTIQLGLQSVDLPENV